MCIQIVPGDNKRMTERKVKKFSQSESEERWGGGRGMREGGRWGGVYSSQSQPTLVQTGSCPRPLLHYCLSPSSFPLLSSSRYVFCFFFLSYFGRISVFSLSPSSSFAFLSPCFLCFYSPLSTILPPSFPLVSPVQMFGHRLNSHLYSEK